ncbi:phosphatidylethanolamine-binding protein [Pyronema omphalodes]|nr:phosphatidylethanolamine-binding protein [Pyronema omphalodes]
MNGARSIVANALRPSFSAPAVPTVAARGLRTRTHKFPRWKPGRPKAVQPRVIETMPFQTFQLAREIIAKDSLEKAKAIEVQKERIMKARNAEKPNQHKIKEMENHLEYLEVQAEINNPRVKYSFDRGMIDMNKPVYRFLADRKWREYRRPVLMQRLTQMNVVPDLLPKIDPEVDVQLRFKGKDIHPGDFVPSFSSEDKPTLKVISFKPQEMLCTVAVIDLDVPNVEMDRFEYRLHWLVSNIPLSHTQTQAFGTGAKPSDQIVQWLPPHVQKGAPYHRYALVVLRQEDKLDAVALKESNIKRDRFVLRSFQAKNKLSPIGAFMFRGQWDTYTKELMQKHNLPGWDQQFVRINENKREKTK